MKKLLVTLIALGFSASAFAGLGATDNYAAHNFADNFCGTTWDTRTAVLATWYSACEETSGTTAWNDSYGAQICAVCHTPHAKDDTTFANGLLWNKKIGATAYTMYDNTITNTVDGDIALVPGATSKLCLSCHDGLQAIDAFGVHIDDVTKTKTMNIWQGTGERYDGMNLLAAGAAGNDLSKSHPIGVEYDNDAGTGDPDLKAPTTAYGGATIADFLVNDGSLDRVECSTCHDVHMDKTATDNAYLLREPIAASQICLACHDK